MSIDILCIPQASQDPSSISAATIDAFPVPSSGTVISLQMTVGGVTSATTIVKGRLSVHPSASLERSV